MISEAIEKMIVFYKGNLHDIDHFIKVWAMAKTIGEQEKLDEKTQQTLEFAAVVHDISCPLCRKKYGNAGGRNQELESTSLVQAFFAELPVPDLNVERVTWLVAHHHTYTNVDSLDHRILPEADFLINAGESGYSRTAIKTARERIFRTETGIRLLDELYRGKGASES